MVFKSFVFSVSINSSNVIVSVVLSFRKDGV